MQSKLHYLCGKKIPQNVVAGKKGYGFQIDKRFPRHHRWNPKKWCWFLRYRIELSVVVPPKSKGALRILFMDNDGEKRIQSVHVNGTHACTIKDFDNGDGFWFEYLFSSVHSRTGKIAVEIRSRTRVPPLFRRNAVISGIEIVA